MCRGRSIRVRQPCRYYLEGTCTRTPCEYWHPPECQFYKTETGCEAGDKCLFPHHEVDEEPNKKPKKGHYSHKRRENDDKHAVVIVKSVPQLGCVSQDSEALVSQSGKQPRGNPMQEVLGTVRKVRFAQSTLRQASIPEKKGPSLGKIQVKNPHQRSPTLWNLRTDLKKRLQDNSDAPAARHGILPEILTSSKKKTKLHSTRPRKNGFSRVRQQKSQRKDSLRWIPEQVCIWSARETLTLLSWRP